MLKIILKTDNMLYNTKSIIKPYELDIYIDEYKLAFEYNGRHWHSIKNNDNKKKQLCINNNITLITIIENSRNYVNDIKKQLIDNIKLLNNITKLNINLDDINNLDEVILYDRIQKNIFDIDDIKNIIDKYDNYHIFKKEESYIFSLLSRNKLLSKYTNHLKRDRILWNEELVDKELSKYINYHDFLINSSECYQYIKKNKLDYKLNKLNRNNTLWDFNKIKELIVKNNFKTTYQLKKKYSGAYRYIIKNNLLNETRNIME